MYFTYILECKDKSLYVGSTNNLKRRLEQHNNSKSGAHYTKAYLHPSGAGYKIWYEDIKNAIK